MGKDFGSEQEELRKRFAELSRRAEERGCCFCSEFLDESQQGLLRSMSRQELGCYMLWGGYEQAERRLACFGAADESVADAALICIEIRPRSRRFAKPVTHRDYLGALLNLGFRRSMIGDILVQTDGAWLFCLKEMADYICEQLQQVGAMSVDCRITENPPAAVILPPEPEIFLSASCRLDALLAAVWDLPRSAAQKLITQGRVCRNDRPTEDASLSLRPGDKISARGYGRFFFLEEVGHTQKGRLKLLLRVYR